MNETSSHTPQRPFFVGQKGEFTLLDSSRQPIETVHGEIVRLMKDQQGREVYAMLDTERGIRPARLA